MEVICNKANKFSSCGWCPHSKLHKEKKIDNENTCIKNGTCILKFDSKIEQLIDNVKCEKEK